MKRTYVKVAHIATGKVYENWFLKYSASDPPINNVSFHENLKKSEFDKLMNSKSEIEALNFQERLKLIALNAPDYYGAATKYNQTLLIRQIGSYMFLTSGFTVTDICQSESWPTDNEGAEIVVCENDLNAEQFWIDYLQKEYPDLKINILNGFRDRSIEDVRNHFSSAKYITFTTTFSKLDWVHLMFCGLDELKGKTVLSHCFDERAQRTVINTFKSDIEDFEDRGNTFTVIDKIS